MQYSIIDLENIVENNRNMIPAICLTGQIFLYKEQEEQVKDTDMFLTDITTDIKILENRLDFEYIQKNLNYKGK